MMHLTYFELRGRGDKAHLLLNYLVFICKYIHIYICIYKYTIWLFEIEVLLIYWFTSCSPDLSLLNFPPHCTSIFYLKIRKNWTILLCLTKFTIFCVRLCPNGDGYTLLFSHMRRRNYKKLIGMSIHTHKVGCKGGATFSIRRYMKCIKRLPVTAGQMGGIRVIKISYGFFFLPVLATKVPHLVSANPKQNTKVKKTSPTS